MKPNKELYLIDGSAYVYRAYHAIRNLSNSKGLATNAAFGFTKMLMKLMGERRPQYAAMFFDAKGPTFRHEIFSKYKANRPPMPEDLAVQLPYIKKITRGFNLPVYELQGYEADDLIGTLARKAEKEGFSVVMVTGDKDFMQLVSEHVTIWDTMKDTVTDLSAIRERFQLDPGQLIDVMGLSGDTSDNVPGVPGIGPKTAASLIQDFGSVEKLYANLETVTRKAQREKLEKYKEQALLSRKLVAICTDAPLEFLPEKLRVGEPDETILGPIYQELEFRQLQKDLPKKTDLSGKDYQAVMDITRLDDLVAKLSRAELFAVDTETTSIDAMRAELVGISFSCTPEEAFYVPVAHTGDGSEGQLSLAEVRQRLKPVLENPSVKKVGQNIKYDWIVFQRHGIHLDGVIFDTMLASYLLQPSKRAHSLDQIALDYLDHKMISYEEVAGKGKSAISFAAVSMDKAVPYACEDADITLAAYQLFRPMLADAGLLELLSDVEMPLVPVLMNMEVHGILVDQEKLKQLSRSFEERLASIETEIYELAGEAFNIKSSQQLGQILFEKLKLPVQKKTKKKTGYSTDVEVLTFLAERHELPALVLRHRTLAKLKSTYTDALLELVNPETGRIHTSYNQTVAATGRLSSSDPNLQNIPIRDEEGREIRSAFIPRKDWVLLSADYSQIELRILAHCSEDEILIRAFAEEEDIHTRTALEVFQVIPNFVTPELRRQAKAINFGIIYGMSPFGLSKALGITQKMAKTYIDSYFARYRGVKAFIDRTIEETRKTGRTSTLLGRIRQLPDINSSNWNVRQFAERIAVNTPIQGSAADLMKLAMIRMDETFKREKFNAAMLLTVHDELVIEVPRSELATVKEQVKKTMEGVWHLKVPLKVNIEQGGNWAEAH